MKWRPRTPDAGDMDGHESTGDDAGVLAGGLQEIGADALRPGRVFAHPLIAADGRVLLHAGIELTAAMCAALLALGVPIMAPASDEDEQARRRAEYRGAWEARRQQRRAVGTLRGEAADVVARRRPLWERLERRIVPTAAALEQDAAEPGAWAESVEQKHEIDRARAAVLVGMVERVMLGEVVSPAALGDVVDDLVYGATRRGGAEAARLERAAFEPGSLEEVMDHALATAELCVHAAVGLGWGEQDVRDAGLTGLLCDWGMTLLPREVRAAPRPMNDEEVNQVRRHAAWSVAMADRMMSAPGGGVVSPRVVLGVYQHHEREDGRGYPERTEGSRVHDLAKLAGAADTLAGLTAERAFRPAASVAGAAERVARMGREGVLAPWAALAVIRACGVMPRAGVVVSRRAGALGGAGV